MAEKKKKKEEYKEPTRYWEKGKQVTKEEYNLAREREKAASLKARSRSLAERTIIPEQRVEEEEERKEAFEEVTGAGALKEELKGKIEKPLSLEPTTKALVMGGLTEEEAQQRINQISNLQEIPSLAERAKAGLPDIAKTIGGMGVAGAAALSLPFLSSLIIKSKIAAAVGKTSGIVKGTALGITSTVIGGKLTDMKGDKVANLRAAIAKIPGQSSTILSAVQTEGLTTQEGMDALRVLSNDVDEAERAIKTAGIYSLSFRYDDEWIPTMQEIKDARLNIIERVGGVIDVATYGRPTLSPEELLFQGEQLGA